MRSTFPLNRALAAGFFAGLTVVVFYFAADLVRLQPLQTPHALASALDFPAFERPVLNRLATPVSVLWVGERLILLTSAHFLAFAALALAGVALFRALDLPFTAWTGAVYGLTVCSLVFFATFSFANTHVLEGIPSLSSVLFANALAGATMGGFMQISGSRATSDG